MFLGFLNKPYPYIPSTRPAWFNNLLIGCFVALFLLVFQPFELNQWQTENRTLKIIGFGFVSFVVPTLLNWVVAKLISAQEREDRWRVWKEILLILSILLSIALGNLLYSNFLGISEISFKGFLYSTLVTLLLGLFPICLAILNKYHRLLRANLEEATLANQHIAQHTTEQGFVRPTEKNSEDDKKQTEKKLVLLAENQKDKLEISESQLLYIESLDNYSTIFYTERETIKKQILRTSLKRLEPQLTETKVVRCHRAFLVNLKNVTKVEGNAAGYKLGFLYTEIEIPVSRNFASGVMEHLKNKL